MNQADLVVILGGDEFGSAIAATLVRARISVVMVLHPQETSLRRSICFSEAMLVGRKEILGVRAELINENILSQYPSASHPEKWRRAIDFYITEHSLPVFLETEFPDYLKILEPPLIIKTHPEFFIDYPLDSASLIIGLHPWHLTTGHCHLSIETRSNQQLGEVFFQPPEALPEFDTHFFKYPFEEIHSPLEGAFISDKNIGEKILGHESIGSIQGIQIRSPYNGQIWGLTHSGHLVKAKQPLALIYQGMVSNAYKLFDYRQKVVAGSVLKEVLHFFRK
jgi:xanthine dehydrogenase accessory factor